jgi:hypothetical protein
LRLVQNLLMHHGVGATTPVAGLGFNQAARQAKVLFAVIA